MPISHGLRAHDRGPSDDPALVLTDDADLDQATASGRWLEGDAVEVRR